MSDLDRLGDYLSSEHSPENSMALSDLDGYLTGAICGHRTNALHKCLAATLGDPARVPDDILDIVVQRHQQILDCLSSGRILEPVFWQAPECHMIAMDWCEGFVDAVKAQPTTYHKLMQTDLEAQLMTPILISIKILKIT